MSEIFITVSSHATLNSLPVRLQQLPLLNELVSLLDDSWHVEDVVDVAGGSFELPDIITRTSSYSHFYNMLTLLQSP